MNKEAINKIVKSERIPHISRIEKFAIAQETGDFGESLYVSSPITEDRDFAREEGIRLTLAIFRDNPDIDIDTMVEKVLIIYDRAIAGKL